MKRYLPILALATILGSCSKILPDNMGLTDGGSSVRFTTDVGARGENITKDNIREFGVFCYDLKGTTWDPATSDPNKMNNLKVTRINASDEWTYGDPIDWEGGDGRLFTFLGYSPYATGLYQEPNNPQGNNIEVITPVVGVPTLKYQTLDYVPMQVDLLLATPVLSVPSQKNVYMMFNHALTQVRFRAWSAKDFVKVKSIEISNIKYAATISISDGAMTVGDSTKTFVLDNINQTISTDELNPTNLSDNANAFMLLPQDLTSNTTAQITVTYDVGGLTKTSTPYTIVQNWTNNTSYTYTITLNENPTEEMLISSVEITDWIVDSEEDMTTTPPPPPQPYIEVDGLKWAIGNLVANGPNGAKIGEPGDAGLYFHFGSLLGWRGGPTGDGTGAATNAEDTIRLQPATYSGVGTWPSPTYSTGTVGTDYRLPVSDSPNEGIGDPCRFYLGNAWRTPTTDEWTLLLGANLEATNKQLPLVHTASNLTFPESGWYTMEEGRGQTEPIFSNGELHLWSSSIATISPDDNKFYSVILAPGPQMYLSNYPTNLSIFQIAMPVRCVSGEYVKPVPAGSYIPTAVLEAAGWPADKLPATGLQVAMRGDKQMPGSGTAATDDPTKEWKTERTTTADVESVNMENVAQFVKGKSNTDAMVATPELAALHPAAQYCRDMGPEWYLPSLKELSLIYDNRDLLGSSYSFYSQYYWSSTMNTSTSFSWYVNFINKYAGNSFKENAYRVRCVREI